MSIISFIGRETDHGVEHIYCHGGGRPWVNGATLLTHYREPDKVGRLIDLGDLSSLGEEIGQRVPFGAAQDNPELRVRQCVAYRRDRREHSLPARSAASPLAFVKAADKHTARACYLFREGRWWLRELPRDTLLSRPDDCFEPLTIIHCTNPHRLADVRALLEWCAEANNNVVAGSYGIKLYADRLAAMPAGDGIPPALAQRLTNWRRTLKADPDHAGLDARSLLELLPLPSESEPEVAAEPAAVAER